VRELYSCRYDISGKIRIREPTFLLREFGSSAVHAGMFCNDGEMKILVFQFAFSDDGISKQSGSFFPSSSVAVVVGGLIFAGFGGCAVHNEGIFCGGFNIDDVFSGEVIFCIGIFAFYVPSCAFDAHAVISRVNFTTNDVVARGLVIILTIMLIC
jgi:hypothetical protein